MGSIAGPNNGELGAWETSVGGVDDLDRGLLLEVLETDCAYCGEAWGAAHVREGEGCEANMFAALPVEGAGSQLTQKWVLTAAEDGDLMRGTFAHLEQMLSVST